ncbi:MAG TPA: hypothetical protein VG294_18750 [Solirubrobacteraceae bacterium]|jgi:hypothetical protein|nr:hypothetical protein [Solirubrobacteraceae bacterium]
MDTSPAVAGARDAARRRSVARQRIATKLTGGGTDGNEQITTIVGTILLVLLAVVGVTIVWIGQLLWLHLFIGLMVIGPVVLKLASTGYRFARYYTRDGAYRRKGPPVSALRLIAPIVVVTTLVVFVSGVILLFVGPADRGQLVLIHKVSFFVWIAFTSLHVLGHLPHMPATLRSVRRPVPELPGLQTGAAGRWLSIAGALVGGLVLAVVLIPDFSIWTAHTALLHHHHH